MVFHYQLCPFLGRTSIPAKWNLKSCKVTIPTKSELFWRTLKWKLWVKFFWSPRTLGQRSFWRKKTAPNLVKFCICGPIYNLQPHIWPSHPVLYFTTQISNEMQQCTSGGLHQVEVVHEDKDLLKMVASPVSGTKVLSPTAKSCWCCLPLALAAAWIWELLCRWYLTLAPIGAPIIISFNWSSLHFCFRLLPGCLDGFTCTIAMLAVETR